MRLLPRGTHTLIAYPHPLKQPNTKRKTARYTKNNSPIEREKQREKQPEIQREKQPNTERKTAREKQQEKNSPKHREKNSPIQREKQHAGENTLTTKVSLVRLESLEPATQHRPSHTHTHTHTHTINLSLPLPIFLNIPPSLSERITPLNQNTEGGQGFQRKHTDLHANLASYHCRGCFHSRAALRNLMLSANAEVFERCKVIHPHTHTPS